MAVADIPRPNFTASVIEPDRSDGSWIQAVRFHRDDLAPGIVTSGIASGTVAFLDNPVARGQDVDQEWTRYEIAHFDSPVCIITADITGDGYSDIIVCHDYGPHILECNMDGGRITWLKNPGRDQPNNTPWEQSFIGQWPAMHRLAVGYFTQRSYLEIIGAPIIKGAHDKVNPVSILRFWQPNSVIEATKWPFEVIDDENFTIVHDLTVKKFGGPDSLDSLLVSSREGLSRLYYEEKEWRREIIGPGEPKEPNQSESSEKPGTGDYWGTGSTDVGKIGNDSFAYIASVDPFHGTTLCVYTKTNNGKRPYAWKRYVLDVFGTPAQQLKHGEGPAHSIVCADFDGDGNDEFLVSLSGPVNYDDYGLPVQINPPVNPYKGILYYKPINLELNMFAKWRISATSSARIAVGHFRSPECLDFASISYNIPGDYQEPDPKTRLFKNTFVPVPSAPLQLVSMSMASRSILPSLWAGEGLIRLRNPALYPENYPMPQVLPLIEVANVEISVQVISRGQEINIPPETGVKVIHGSLELLDRHGEAKELRDSLGLVWPEAKSTTSTYSRAKACVTGGAIVLWMRPMESTDNGWPTAPDVPVLTALDLSESGLQPPNYKFVKVESLPWGEEFVGVDFWKMRGFHFRFYEDSTHLAHIQFWAAGKNVDCGIHNHRYELFGETHVCLSNGTNNGGMWRMKEKHINIPRKKGKKLPDDEFEYCFLKPFEEHGGMWLRGANGKAVRRPDRTLCYPWHKWQAGEGSNMDVWMAIEFNPKLL
ncbi:hypothetical protein V8C35DRAFT_331580 [Trichoderma chlorosporum]